MSIRCRMSVSANNSFALSLCNTVFTGSSAIVSTIYFGGDASMLYNLIVSCTLNNGCFCSFDRFSFYFFFFFARRKVIPEYLDVEYNSLQSTTTFRAPHSVQIFVSCSLNVFLALFSSSLKIFY